MSDSVYISKNITGDQLKFLILLDEYEIAYFRIEDIESKLGHSFSNLNEVLENLVDKELLVRIERGKYRRHTFHDPYVIGTFISKSGVVAYWSALNLHGLTDQFPNTVFIQTIGRKRDKKIDNLRYKFITVAARKQVGVTQNGYGNYRYPITDVDKTIIDCFDLPAYSGGYAVLIEALASATLHSNKLIAYCEAIGNESAIRRLAYLCELLEKENVQSFLEYAQTKVKQKYVLIDPAGGEQGDFNARWKLRLNISEKEFLQMAQDIY